MVSNFVLSAGILYSHNGFELSETFESVILYIFVLNLKILKPFALYYEPTIWILCALTMLRDVWHQSTQRHF